MGFTVYILEPAGTLCVVVVGCQGDITTNAFPNQTINRSGPTWQNHTPNNLKATNFSLSAFES